MHYTGLSQASPQELKDEPSNTATTHCVGMPYLYQSCLENIS